MSTWKGMFLGLAALASVAMANRAFASACGDLNNNGISDPGDSTILVQRIFGGPNAGDCGGLGTLQCGDINGSGTLTVADLTVELNLVAQNPVIFNCVSPGGAESNATLTGTIGTNRTLSGAGGSNVHTVNGTTFIAPGVVLTIQPGAIVQGVKGAPTPSVLVFRPGSKINAAGTPANPIIFTSNQPNGSRGIGDWGGVVINGLAPANCPSGACLAEGLTGVEFGGTNPDDSSGVLQYARIEYSGIELSNDNELNILTQNAVGRGTVEDHIQVNHGFDDGFEWFGGTVNMKYIVASSIGDDDFDWQLGYTGHVQFGLGIKNANNSDTNGRHVFEGDNNENNFAFLPRSNPVFCNMTAVGTVPQGQAAGVGGRRGALLRRGTAGKIFNTIIDGFTQSGIQMDDNATAAQACVAGPALRVTEDLLSLKHVTLFGNGALSSGSATSPCSPSQWISLLGATISTADPNIVEAPYPAPGSGAPGADGYVPTSGPATADDCESFDPGFFDAAAYMGAFAPGSGIAGNWLRDMSNVISFDTD